MSFKDKVVLVTGGSSGIGATTAIFFAREGAEVAIVGRNQTKLKKITEEINKVGKPPLVITADVGIDEEAKTIVKKTVEKFGKLDVLVNNAGILRTKTILDEDLLLAYDEVMNVNLRSIVLLTNLAAPHLIKSKGNIVNISSIAATSQMVGFGTGYISYCTSKAGVDHFSRVAAVELAEKGVRVNVVSPGPVETDIVENAGRDWGWESLAQNTALKILTQPEEVAEMILYVASDKAKSVTGSTFLIDGGTHLKF